MPPGIIEATTAILMNHLQAGKYLFGRDPVKYTHCREEVEGHKATIGFFGATGFHIGIDRRIVAIFDADGLASLRKF